MLENIMNPTSKIPHLQIVKPSVQRTHRRTRNANKRAGSGGKKPKFRSEGGGEGIRVGEVGVRYERAVEISRFPLRPYSEIYIFGAKGEKEGRKKKREEEGKQKEEERRKREREHRKKQEANNLEETKEQIAQLETKLSSLKEEKHQLFLTLKKVLNEDDVRRKKESSELSALYPQPHPNVLPLSGHIVQPPGSSRYLQPGQSSSQHRAAGLYMKPPSASSSSSPHLKRGRSPSPASA